MKEKNHPLIVIDPIGSIWENDRFGDNKYKKIRVENEELAASARAIRERQGDIIAGRYSVGIAFLEPYGISCGDIGDIIYSTYLNSEQDYSLRSRKEVINDDSMVIIPHSDLLVDCSNMKDVSHLERDSSGMFFYVGISGYGGIRLPPRKHDREGLRAKLMGYGEVSVAGSVFGYGHNHLCVEGIGAEDNSDPSSFYELFVESPLVEKFQVNIPSAHVAVEYVPNWHIIEDALDEHGKALAVKMGKSKEACLSDVIEQMSPVNAGGSIKEFNDKLAHLFRSYLPKESDLPSDLKVSFSYNGMIMRRIGKGEREFVLNVEYMNAIEY